MPNRNDFHEHFQRFVYSLISKNSIKLDAKLAFKCMKTLRCHENRKLLDVEVQDVMIINEYKRK